MPVHAMMDDRAMTTLDAAARLGRSDRQVRRWCALGWIVSSRLPNGAYVIAPDEVEAAIRHGVPTPDSPHRKRLSPRAAQPPASGKLYSVLHNPPAKLPETRKEEP